MDKISKLQALHSEISQGLSVLERLVQAARPDMRALSKARLGLTRASKRRTEYIDTVLVPHLRASNIAKDALHELRKEMVHRRAASSEHISRWPPAAIERDWEGYQQASLAIRAAMRLQMRRERETLAPFLRQSVSHGGTVP